MAASIGSPFRLVLVAVDDDLASAWDRSSPANSFGFMNGGIDAVYARRFGVRLVSRVRDQILEHHGGKLLVGDAEVIETADSDIPFLICAPTMRVPMLVSDTVNPATLAEASTRHEALAVERSRR